MKKIIYTIFRKLFLRKELNIRKKINYYKEKIDKLENEKRKSSLFGIRGTILNPDFPFKI